MKVLLLDTYYGDSHKIWAEGLKKNSIHQFKILSLSSNHWKWRMQSGAIFLANQINTQTFLPDVVLATSMVNLALLKSLTNLNWSRTKLVLYFHENQLAYPFSSRDTDLIQKRDNHYGFMQFTSALIANEVWFNSNYNQNSFFDSLELFLAKMPKPSISSEINKIRKKSKVIPLGFSFPELTNHAKPKSPKTVLWNHRWEEDKNPKEFLLLLKTLKSRDIPFNLIVTGVKNEEVKKEFKFLGNQLLYFGFAESKSQYWQLLQESDILVSTSNQEFFGISVVEAVYAGCFPILPKRLSYLEIFKGFDVFYKDFNDLTNRVEDALNSNSLKSLSQQMRQYSWEKISPIYDSALANLPNNY